MPATFKGTTNGVNFSVQGLPYAAQIHIRWPRGVSRSPSAPGRPLPPELGQGKRTAQQSCG